MAHASHHVIPHYNGQVRPFLLDGPGQLGHMTQEKLLHCTAGRAQPQFRLIPLTERIHLEDLESELMTVLNRMHPLQKRGPHLISSNVQRVQARMQLHHLSQHLHHQPNTLLFVWVQGAHTIWHLS